MDFLQRHTEALLFCATQPLLPEDIQACLSEMFEADVDIAHIHHAIAQLQARYAGEEYSFELLKAAGGYQFMTKPAYQESIALLLKQQSKKRLSKATLETLAIIAYRQPITKTDIEQIRGVNCDYAVKRLLEKELVEMRGKSDTAGRPVLYGTTSKFLEYFGINDLKEMPTPKDIVEEEHEIGEAKE